MRSFQLFRVSIPRRAALDKIAEVFASGYVNEGQQVMQLTVELQHILNAQNLILVNSCTSALTLALKLAGVAPGDDVVSTPMTCVATNAAIAAMGANIVWADIDPSHGMLDPQSVKQRITPKTKAVMVVAWAGTPPELEKLRTICNQAGVKLILDAAHAFLAHYKNEPVHRWAHYTCYSFQAIKHFSTGDGGALVCQDDEDYKRSKALKWFGLDRDRAKDEKGDWKGQQWDVDIPEIGYKFNMNNVAAAIGLAGIDAIASNVKKHRNNARVYDVLLSKVPSIELLKRPDKIGSSHWVYTVLVNPQVSKLKRDKLLKALNDRKVMAGVVHVPNDTYTCFKSSKIKLPGVRKFSSRQLSLPCGWWLSVADVKTIVKIIEELTL